MNDKPTTTEELRTAIKVLNAAQEYTDEYDERMANALFSDAESNLVAYCYPLTGEMTVLDERR